MAALKAVIQEDIEKGGELASASARRGAGKLQNQIGEGGGYLAADHRAMAPVVLLHGAMLQSEGNGLCFFQPAVYCKGMGDAQGGGNQLPPLSEIRIDSVKVNGFPWGESVGQAGAGSISPIKAERRAERAVTG